MRPSYAPQLPVLVEGDLITWEAEMEDGSTVRERLGASMRDVDRERLACFRLVAPGELIAEFTPPEGADGRHLMYRRRTATRYDGERRVVFLIAWAPMGPAIMIDPASGTYREEASFIEGDPDMFPPEPAVEDGPFLLDKLLPRT